MGSSFKCNVMTIILQFYIVSGGYSKTTRLLASTEILKKEGGTSWQTAASLPSARGGLRGVSLPNGHFMVSGASISSMFYDNWWHIITGGLDKTRRNSLSDVLDYDPDEDKWTKVGEMAKGRTGHAMSLVPAKTADYCVWYLGTEILCYDFI